MKIQKYLILTIIALISFNQLYSQVTGGDFKDLMKDEFESKMGGDKLLTKESMPVGNKIDPKFYYLGAGDVLSIKIMPQSVNSNIIEITPDGKLILPRSLGDIDLQGKTLFEAQELITNIVLNTNPKSTVNLSLSKARSCLVNITGNVLLPGSFAFPASYRISTILNYLSQVGLNSSNNQTANAMHLKNQEAIRDLEKKFSQSGLGFKTVYSNRNIVLINEDGTSKVLDVEKALFTKDPLNDPYIKEGDKIIVPFEEQYYPKISITGAIVRPVTVVFKKGDKLSQLVKFGVAANEYTDFSNVKLIFPNGTVTKIEVDESLNLKSSDVDLQPGTNIIFGSLPRQTNFNIGVVGIIGEISNEGSYPISNNQTKVSEVVKLAGGLKEEASLEQAYIIRKNPNLSEDLRSRPLMESLENSDLTLEDTMRYFIDVQNNNYFVSCDMKAAIKDENSSNNVKLQDGDFIVIPKKMKRIYIFGRIAKPGYLEFVENKNLDFYIAKAGGFTKNADQSRSRIIRGASNVWIKPNDDVAVLDGDRIYVPAPPDIPQQVSDAKYGMLAGIVGASVSVIYLLINTVFKKN